MLNKSKFKTPTIIAFLCLELALGILVQLTSNNLNTAVSFSCVVLACLFCALFFEKSNSYFLTQTGLLCTVCADIFLVVLKPMLQLPAMLFFSVTQICYFIRLYQNQVNAFHKRLHLIFRALTTLIAIFLTVIVLKEKTDALSLVSLFYYANLIFNIIIAFCQFKRCPVLAIGLLLFLMCDTVIGLNIMASSYISSAKDSLIYRLLNPGFNLAWVFYVPSQSLIAISLSKKHKE